MYVCVVVVLPFMIDVLDLVLTDGPAGLNGASGDSSMMGFWVVPVTSIWKAKGWPM